MFKGLRPARFLSQSPLRDSILRSLRFNSHLQQGPSKVRQFTSRPTFSPTAFTSRISRALPVWRSHIARATRGRRYNSNPPSPNPTPHLGSPQPQGLSGRLKELSRRYGWAAVGVYFGLSILDFPFCFLAVRMLGAERVGKAEHWVVHKFWTTVAMVAPSMQPEHKLNKEVVEDEGKQEEPSIWTQLLIAYGVHKSLIFFRVPLTAAVTPKVVKFLRARGWNIGKPKMAAPLPSK